MKLNTCLVFGFSLLIATSAAAQAATTTYKGLCEASAGTYVDADHFVVASDETNVLRLYKRGDTSEGVGLDFQGPTGYDKSDIEAAAKSGDMIYWISSHSLNSDGEDKKKRKIFFATKVVAKNGATALEWAGAFPSLRDPIAKIAGVKKSELNIEGMAATSNGGLLIGLRDTLDGHAIVIPFENPSEVIANPNTKPNLGKPFHIKLGGKGVRSMEQMENGYLIVAGPVSDEGSFSLFTWPGNDDPPKEIKEVAFGFLRPEALMRIPGTETVQILSDDGAKDCDDEKSPIAKRAFRSLDLKVEH